MSTATFVAPFPGRLHLQLWLLAVHKHGGRRPRKSHLFFGRVADNLGTVQQDFCPWAFKFSDKVYGEWGIFSACDPWYTDVMDFRYNSLFTILSTCSYREAREPKWVEVDLLPVVVVQVVQGQIMRLFEMIAGWVFLKLSLSSPLELWPWYVSRLV